MHTLDLGALGASGRAGDMAAQRARMMAQIDTNGDGRLGFDELEATERGAKFADALRAFDKDGSGDLSSDEMTAAREQIAARAREAMQHYTTLAPQADPNALFAELFGRQDD